MHRTSSEPLPFEMAQIRWEDRERIEAFASRYPPYSDFVFATLYCWNTDGKTLFALHGDTLIVTKKDYVHDHQICTFLGSTVEKELVLGLLRSGLELKLIPEVAAQYLPSVCSEFTIVEDRDNHDYEILTAKAAALEGPLFAGFRNKIRKFRSLYPHMQARAMDPSDPKARASIVEMFDTWALQKGLSLEEVLTERRALLNALEVATQVHAIILGVYDGTQLVGFVQCEPIKPDYVILHFAKSDLRFRDLSLFLHIATFEWLSDHGYSWVNMEMDLGIAGLRIFKESWRPAHFLKKYRILPQSRSMPTP